MLIFNLTGIKSTEQILQSKLYLMKKRRPKSGKRREMSNFRLKIGCLPRMTSHRYIDISLTRQKSEWHSYDISESVVTCRQSKKVDEYLLGLTLEARRPKGSYRLSPFKRLVKANSQPFVLIFSEDNQNQPHLTNYKDQFDNYEDIGKLLSAKADEEGTLPEEFLDQASLARTKRSAVVTESKDLKYNSDGYPLPHALEAFLFSKRFQKVSESKTQQINKTNLVKILQTVMNQVQYVLNVNAGHLNAVQKNSRGKLFQEAANSSANYFQEPVETDFETPSRVLASKPEMGYNRFGERENIVSSAARATGISDLYLSDENNRPKRSISNAVHYSTIPKDPSSADTTINSIQAVDEKYVHKSNPEMLPVPRRRTKQRTTTTARGKQNKKRRRHRKLPFWWTRHDSKFHVQDYSKLCKRKSLVVDFSQIGWDDWIISPKSFNAHYCSGGCTFPLIKDAKPSNHAAIQSLIHAIGLNPNVPTPCCVPSVTSSLTLLYFDENGSLVLKNYPNMIVEKCACR